MLSLTKSEQAYRYPEGKSQPFCSPSSCAAAMLPIKHGLDCHYVQTWASALSSPKQTTSRKRKVTLVVVCGLLKVRQTIEFMCDARSHEWLCARSYIISRSRREAKQFLSGYKHTCSFSLSHDIA